MNTNTVLSVSYIGSQSRHLLTVHGANPGVPALCLSLSQPQDLAPGTLTCGPFGENDIYTRSDGAIVNGTCAPFPNSIGTDAYDEDMDNAGYNALEFTWKRNAGPLTMLQATPTASRSTNLQAFRSSLIPMTSKKLAPFPVLTSGITL